MGDSLSPKLLFLCALWLTLCLSLIVGLPEGNETRNVSLSDQVSKDDDSKVGCLDWEGKLVKDGEKYVPNKNDMCMRCTCAGRFPVICHSVACSPPETCSNPIPVSGACCEYQCPDDTSKNVTENNPSAENTESITNLSLRLIASTVTSLLFLALLLFMVHRLRQRRMLLAMRRFQARSDVCISDDMDGDRTIPDNFMSLECPPYTDPPPPYSPPKPPHILPGEQPPAYDEISIAENASRETRSRSGQEDINTQEARLVRETGPVIAQLHNELSQSNGFHQIYSSPQSPSFGVVMEMPRSPVQSQDTTENQNDNRNVLPAYASTDILFRNATFSTMVTPPHSQTDASDTSDQVSNNDANREDTCHAEAAGMPTLTAFQRFSSLFKRDKSKYKNRSSQQQRPASEFVPPHYATLSRSHRTLTVINPDDNQSVVAENCLSNVTYRNSYSRNGGSRVRSSYPNLSLTSRMRLSYDSARAAYELAALSPSTSSSSSISIEQLPMQDGSITTSCVPLSTYSTGALPPSQSTTCHPQEFPPVLQQVKNSGDSDLINHSSTHSASVDLKSSASPHRTSGEFNKSHQFHCPSKCVNDSVQYSPNRNSLSRGINERNTPPSNNLHFNSNSGGVETKECNLKGNNLDDGHSHGNRIRNFNPGINSHSPILLGESSRCESPPVGEEVPRGNSAAFPPSPLPALGQMRRSHSSTSQVSAFSICSETGEKRLKDEKHESDRVGETLASDGQYPPHPVCSSQSYSKSLRNSPHSNLSLLRGHINPPIKRNPVTSTLDPALQPATLVVPITSHLSIPSDSPSSSHNNHFRQKDLHIDIQDFTDDNLSSTAVQSSPVSPPFVTVQSGKLISNPPPPAPAVEWTASHDICDPSARIGYDNVDDNKKFRKRIEKEKRAASLSFKPKDGASSPSQGFKDVIKTKYDLSNVRNKHSRNTSAKGVVGRKTDKKRLQHFQQAAPCSNIIDSSILPNFEDFSSPYGNADVYRSQACDASSATSSFSVLASPIHKFVENNLDAVQLPIDCGPYDVKKNHTFFSPKMPVPDSEMNGHNITPSSSRRLQQTSIGSVKYPSPQSRKKPGHKRQTISANRNTSTYGHSSASQKHNHSKSVTTANPMQETDPVLPNDTAFEQVISDGRWVKSGFGHDLAFDDQSGMIDMGMTDKIMDLHYHYNPMVKISKGESSNVPKNLDGVHSAHGPESKVATASVVPLTTRRRSGLSQDLLFVNRSEANSTKRLNKRSSLPGFLTFASQQPPKTYCDNSDYVVAENLHPRETEMPQKQLKNSKERRERSNSYDKNERYTATSYV